MISTGGGVLVDESNCAALKRVGVIVCLTARPEVVAARVERSKAKRPKLTEGGKPTLARIKELMAERADAYARADVQVDTSDLTVEQLADHVIAAFGAHAARRILPSRTRIMMRTIRIELGPASHDAHVGAGILDGLANSRATPD